MFIIVKWTFETIILRTIQPSKIVISLEVQERIIKEQEELSSLLVLTCKTAIPITILSLSSITLVTISILLFITTQNQIVLLT